MYSLACMEMSIPILFITCRVCIQVKLCISHFNTASGAQPCVEYGNLDFRPNVGLNTQENMYLLRQGDLQGKG